MNKFFKALLVALLLAVTITIGILVKNYATAKIEIYMHPQKYSEYVSRYCAEFEVPETLCYAVIKCESSFDPLAKSYSNAIGLMQMKPATFADLCSRLKEEHHESMLYDPETSIKYGVYYLSLLYKRFGVWETAVAAYNAGQGRVAKWIAEGNVTEDGYLTEIPIEETATYVQRVNNAIEIYKKLYYQ